MRLQYTLVESVSTRIPKLPEIVRAAPAWPTLASDLPALAQFGRRALGTEIADHRTSWVRRLATDRGVFYIKCYEFAGCVQKLAQLWRRPAALLRPRVRREFDALEWLRAHDFAAPEPVLALEWRRFGWLQLSALVTKEVPGQRADTLLPSLPPDARRDLARALGAFVDRLHAAGFRDRNLDLRNLIVATGADGSWRIAKLDSPRFRLRSPGDREDALARGDWQRLLPQLRAFDLEGAAREGAQESRQRRASSGGAGPSGSTDSGPSTSAMRARR